MPWVRAKLRDSLVYARVDASGALVAEKGRVEVRYKPTDGRAYRASASNLVITDPTPLPDDTCSEAQPAQVASKASAKAAAEAPAPDGMWEAWTDGACSGNPGPAGLGIVLLKPDERVEVSEYLGRATNNIAELTAVLRALERVPAEQPLLVRTDSQYSIGVLQKGWKAKANGELIESIRTHLRTRPATRLLYTPGHAGVSLNERADQLARMAVATAASSVRAYPRKPKTDEPEQK